MTAATILVGPASMDQSDTPKPLLIVLVGPTASGKTGLAMQLAAHLDIEILPAVRALPDEDVKDFAERVRQMIAAKLAGYAGEVGASGQLAGAGSWGGGSGA